MRDRFCISMIKGIEIYPTHSILWRKTNMFLSLLALAVTCVVGTGWPMFGSVFAEGGDPPKANPSADRCPAPGRALGAT